MAMILDLEKTLENIKENKEIINSEKDAELQNMAQEEMGGLEEKAAKLTEDIEEEVNPSSPNDKKNAIIEIRAGAGGDEAALFAGDLFRMYARYCERQGWKMELIDSSALGIGGYKEIIFTVKGEGAYGLLKFEAGTHRVQRVPETEKQGRVHTSTATVVVLPEAEEVDVEIKLNDVRIDTFCSSGPGGQSVNTTYSAIRLFHIPTGITVSCQDQKSQHQNKEKAFQVLRSRILAKQEEERMQSESSARKIQVGGGDRSDKIRTYNFPQDRVTDHRINISWHSINRLMDGEIDEIVKSLKKAAKEEVK
jgi:peptide chain release factor 1